MWGMFRHHFKTFLALLGIGLCLWHQPASALLDFKKGAFIRDSELEAMLRAYTDPLFKVAGLTPGDQKFFIAVDPTINAAATVGNILMINTGFLIQAKSPWEVIGVLAHETGHLAGRHIVRGEVNANTVLMPTLLAGALGTVAAAAAGGAEGAAATLMGTMQVLDRSLLKHSRGQEAAADQMALRYLKTLNWSAEGLLIILETFADQALLLEENQDPYVRTHPLTDERLATVKNYVQNTKEKSILLPTDFAAMFERVQAKLKAFLEPPEKTLKAYPSSNISLVALYARAIAYLRLGNTTSALSEIDKLLKDHPNDPFFWELKGQILFFASNIKDSIHAYKQSLELRPKDLILELTLAQVLLEDTSTATAQEAREILKNLLKTDPEEAWGWKLLAIAQGRLNEMGEAALSLSEYALRIDNKKEARAQVERALKILKKGTSAYLRAEDIKNSIKDNDS